MLGAPSRKDGANDQRAHHAGHQHPSLGSEGPQIASADLRETTVEQQRDREQRGRKHPRRAGRDPTRPGGSHTWHSLMLAGKATSRLRDNPDSSHSLRIIPCATNFRVLHESLRRYVQDLGLALIPCADCTLRATGFSVGDHIGEFLAPRERAEDPPDPPPMSCGTSLESRCTSDGDELLVSPSWCPSGPAGRTSRPSKFGRHGPSRRWTRARAARRR